MRLNTRDFQKGRPLVSQSVVWKEPSDELCREEVKAFVRMDSWTI